jgi:Mu transposase, C-terminal
MRTFIRNTIDRLRGYIRGARDTTKPTVESVHPIPDETDLDIQLPRLLTPSGIRFKSIRYHSAELAEMVWRMKSGDRVKVMIKDPTDLASILVWDGTARPTPRWITVPIAGEAAGQRLSFAHAAARDFARSQHLAFSTEAGRLEALERLRQHWEKLAVQPHVHEIRQARRHVGAWDAVPDDDVRFTLKDPLTDIEAVANRKSPPRRRSGKPAIAKAKLTKHRKKTEIKTRKPRPAGKKNK